MQTFVTMNNNIPYANGVLLSYESSEDTIEAAVTAEAKNAPELLWFCFRLEFKNRIPTRKKLRLVIKYFYNSLWGFPVEKVHPVTRTPGNEWTRMSAGKTLPLPDGRFDAVWETEITADTMDFAFCFPYGMPEIEDLVRKSGGYFKSDVIGLTSENRNLVRLSNSYGDIDNKKPGLYLIARQHAAETSGSWVLHGFLERLAEVKADNLTVWCIPLANIDGIEKGYYGKDNFPIDINRAWGSPPMRHENLVFQRDIERWTARSKPVLSLDFHSPAGAEDEGVYCFVPSDENWTPDSSSTVWGDALKKSLSPDFALADFCKVARYGSRWETPCFSYYKFMRKVLGIPSLSFEFPYSAIREKVLQTKDYREIGARMADAVIQKLQNN